MIYLKYQKFLFCFFMVLAYAECLVKVTMNDVELAYISPKYFNTSDNYIKLNMETGEFDGKMVLKEGLPEETVIKYYMFGYQQGDYDQETGIGNEMLMCDGFDEPIVFAPLLEAQGVDRDHCPMKAGAYPFKYEYLQKYYSETFPPNHYMSKYQMLIDDEIIYDVRVYYEVE